MSDRTEQELLEEIRALTQVVAAQEQATAAAVDEVRRTHATLSWRIHLRLKALTERMLRNRVLREPYRMVRRAIEIWVEHGFLYIFRFGARKIGLLGPPAYAAPVYEVPPPPPRVSPSRSASADHGA